MEQDLRQRIIDLDPATLLALTGGEALALDHIDKGTQKITLGDIRRYFGIERYDVLVRELFCSTAEIGKEWDLEELMDMVSEEAWTKFATGDYYITTNTDGEKIKRVVAGKNHYLHCGDTPIELPHIVTEPRDCLETLYQYNTTNTNAGGYAASLMPANMEKEFGKLSNAEKKYATPMRRLENNKDTWAWATRNMFLPPNAELIGNMGFANGWGGGSPNQLRLHVGGTVYTLKGRGYNKKTEQRRWYWTADPSSANSADFCYFGHYGHSDHAGASNPTAVAPLLVLSKAKSTKSA